MKQKYIKKGMMLTALFFSSFVFSQTITQIEEIQKKTNVETLKILEKKFRLQQNQEKQRALTLAQINGWPLTYTDQNGSYNELISVTEDNKPIYYSTSDYGAAVSTRTNWLHNGGGLGLDLEGQGMTAYVWDGGIARDTHQEYDGIGGDNRYSVGDGTGSRNFHASHVTGTIISSGVVVSAKGMAPQAKAIGHDWNNDESEATLAASNGMLLSNHSYGYQAPSIPDSWFGAYLADGRNMDEIMYNAPYYLQVTAAGNDGNDNFSNGNPLGGNSQYDKISGLQTSKNGLTVANGQDATIDTDGNLVSVVRNSGSSEGPMDDLRIKPDIMGNGTGLNSSYESADDAYGIISGTSMASPNVTGSLLLLQQHYNNLNGSFMRASTLKGLALHTADDIGLVGPDAQHGWGLMNSKKAAETITKEGLYSIIREEVLAQGETFTMTVRSDGTSPLLASISWTDLPGQLSSGVNDATPVLVNDLDIKITQNTDTFEPWMLTSVSSNTNGDNTVDPYERIDIDGAVGEYTITVTHKGTLSGGPQVFSLIVTGSQSDFAITSTNSSLNQCSDSDAIFNFDYVQTLTTTTNFSFQNLPAGTSASLSTPSLDADGSFTFTVSGLENLDAGTYEIDVIGDNGNEIETRSVSLRVYHPSFDSNPMTISYPANEQRGIIFPQTFLVWNENINAESYYVEVSDDPSFTNIISSGTKTDFEFGVTGLTNNTVYYWRIKPSNICGEGGFSETFSFQTANSEDCSNTYSATDFSESQIFENANNTANVPIVINDDIIISRLIVNTDITHESVEDLVLFIQEPEALGSNNTILLENVCDTNDNISNLTFDDTAVDPLSCNNGDPAITGTITPVQSLNGSVGRSALGTWFFAVTDTEFIDGGNIDSASITICTPTANTSIPNFVNNSIDIAANGSYTIETSDIEASSASEVASQQTYTLVVLPTKGDITKNNIVLGVGDTFTQEDVDLGSIAFKNTQTVLFTDSFMVDITNGVNGWLPNQQINFVATTLSSNTFELSNLSLYPNPSNGIINIRFETSSNNGIEVALFDLQGRSIYRKNFSSNESLFEDSINIGKVANGIYLIKINQGNRSTTKRIVISK